MGINHIYVVVTTANRSKESDKAESHAAGN
jgi:hypothetical protein